MSFGELCTSCYKGQLRPFQISVSEAIIKCSNTECEGYLDYNPKQSIVPAGSQLSGYSSRVGSRIGSRACSRVCSYTSSSPPPLSPTHSQLSITDQEVEYLSNFSKLFKSSKSSGIKSNKSKANSHCHGSKATAVNIEACTSSTSTWLDSQYLKSSLLQKSSENYLQSHLSDDIHEAPKLNKDLTEWERLVSASAAACEDLSGAPLDVVDHFLDSLVSEAPTVTQPVVNTNLSLGIPSHCSAFSQVASAQAVPQQSTDSSSCSANTSKENYKLPQSIESSSKDDTVEISIKDDKSSSQVYKSSLLLRNETNLGSTLKDQIMFDDKQFVSPAGSVVSEDSGYNDEISASVAVSCAGSTGSCGRTKQATTTTTDAVMPPSLLLPSSALFLQPQHKQHSLTIHQEHTDITKDRSKVLTQSHLLQSLSQQLSVSSSESSTSPHASSDGTIKCPDKLSNLQQTNSQTSNEPSTFTQAMNSKQTGLPEIISDTGSKLSQEKLVQSPKCSLREQTNILAYPKLSFTDFFTIFEQNIDVEDVAVASVDHGIVPLSEISTDRRKELSSPPSIPTIAVKSPESKDEHSGNDRLSSGELHTLEEAKSNLQKNVNESLVHNKICSNALEEKQENVAECQHVHLDTFSDSIKNKEACVTSDLKEAENLSPHKKELSITTGNKYAAPGRPRKRKYDKSGKNKRKFCLDTDDEATNDNVKTNSLSECRVSGDVLTNGVSDGVSDTISKSIGEQDTNSNKPNADDSAEDILDDTQLSKRKVCTKRRLSANKLLIRKSRRNQIEYSEETGGATPSYNCEENNTYEHDGREGAKPPPPPPPSIRPSLAALLPPIGHTQPGKASQYNSRGSKNNSINNSTNNSKRHKTSHPFRHLASK